MEIERETLIEIAVSVLGVGLFIVATILVGAMFNQDGLTEDGAFALLGVIVVFVLVMAVVGYWLSGREN